MRTRLKRLCRLIGVLTLGVAVTPVATAWGPEGHAIVADIAQAHLTPRAAARVEALLRLEGHDRLDQVSSWADGNRKQHPHTGRWHYVDIPLAAPGYVAARDCPQGDCVVERIATFTHVLADPAQSPEARLEALKWVVHFVGDVHQPMHAVDHDDKGGNTVQVQFFGRGTNLHAMWDGGVLRHALNLTPGPNYSFDHAVVQADASMLDSRISTTQRAQWAPSKLLPELAGQAIGWADESHRLAQQVAYPGLEGRNRPGWSQRYQDAAWPAVQARLEQAGVRLAEVLNEALGQ